MNANNGTGNVKTQEYPWYKFKHFIKKEAKQVKQTEQTNEYSAKQTKNNYKTLFSAKQEKCKP